MRSALHSAIAMTALMAQSTFAAGDHAKGKVAFAAKCGICQRRVLEPTRSRTGAEWHLRTPCRERPQPY